MQNLHLITRDLINEMLTPEEEREWMTYTAHLPKQELDEAREHLVSARVITLALVRLMKEGATPESEPVQKLLLQNNQLMLKYRFRERLVSRGVWNATVTQKVQALGHRLVLKTSTTEGGVPEDQLLAFCGKAHKAAKWRQALDAIAAEAISLNERNAGPHSAGAQALAQRLSEVCETALLGDPALYGRWYVDFGRMPSDAGLVPVDERHRAAWTLLIEAVEASRRPAGMRTAAAW
jgi:hypothetical protein